MSTICFVLDFITFGNFCHTLEIDQLHTIKCQKVFCFKWNWKKYFILISKRIWNLEIKIYWFFKILWPYLKLYGDKMDIFVEIKIWTWAKSKQKKTTSPDLLSIFTNFNQKSKFIRKIRHARLKTISLLILDRIQLTVYRLWQVTSILVSIKVREACNFGGIFLLKIKWKYLQFSLHFLLIYSPY